MGDINGRHAQQWKRLQTPFGQKGAKLGFQQIKNISDPKLAAAANAIISAMNAIVEGHATDLHGDANQDKYRYIVDLILTRVKSYLETDFTKNQLAQLKAEIVASVKNSQNGFISSIFKMFLAQQLSSLFSDNATKGDIEQLKQDLIRIFKNDGKNTDSDVTLNAQTGEHTEEKRENETDNDSLNQAELNISQYFDKLTAYISELFDKIDEKICGLGFGKPIRFITDKIKSVMKSLNGLKDRMYKFISRTGRVLGGIAKFVGSKILNGIFSTVKLISGGVKNIIGSVGALGSKVGAAIASPFKKIGGFFAKFNPFSKSKKEMRKQAAKDKLQEVMASIVGKLWNIINPFVPVACLAFALLGKWVISPLQIILTSVLSVITTLTVLGILAYIAYKWIKAKIIEYWTMIKAKAQALWDYVVGGELWNDIKAGLLKAFEWLTDFGKWLWDLFLKAMKFIWCDIWVMLGKWIWEKLCEFGEWIWEKLCEFGNWLYDKFIDPVVAPIKVMLQHLAALWVEKIQPVVQPFIDSLTDLKNRIVKAFSAWDSNKSIWENLKNMTSIIKDAVLDWWNTSPFKTFYEQYLDPIIMSVQNLIARIQQIWQNFNWDENLSFIENLMCFWDNVKSAITEWWEGSIIKEYWDKLVNYLSDLVKPIVDWYEKSELKKWIDKVFDICKVIKDAVVSWWKETQLAKMIEEIKTKGFMNWLKDQMSPIVARVDAAKSKLAEIKFSIPQISFGDDISFYKPTTWFKFGWKDITPFGFLANKSTEGAIQIQNATSGANNADNVNDIAQQQVAGMAQPVIQLDTMKEQQQQNLSEEAKLYSQAAAEKSQQNDANLNESTNATKEMIEYMKVSEANRAKENEMMIQQVMAAATAGSAAGTYRNNMGSLLMQENR